MTRRKKKKKKKGMRMRMRRGRKTTMRRRYRRANLKYDMTPLLQEIFIGESTSQSDFVCLFVLNRLSRDLKNPICLIV